MARRLLGPDETYTITIEAFITAQGGAVRRFEVGEGQPCSGVRFEDGRARPCFDLPEDRCRSFLVRACPSFSFLLEPLESGLMVRSASLLDGGSVTVTARVEAGPGALEWLPDCASYVLFNGDAGAIAAVDSRYIPFTLSGEGLPDQRTVAVDRLVAALGRSVARANAKLVRTTAEGGVALVSVLNIRVGVVAYDVSGNDRVILTLPESGEKASQFIELTMRTVPGEESEDPPEGS